MEQQQRLGRGLSAIFGEHEEIKGESQKLDNVSIDLIETNKSQPRKYFDMEKLRELADSIALHGVLQPIAVRKNGNNYELLAGERRLRAAKMAGLLSVPVHVLQCSDGDVLAIALIENIQRDDLNAIEEAIAFKSLVAEHKCTQENLAFMVCKSRSYIANSMRLLSLPEVVQKMVTDGLLSAGHARLLVGFPDAEEIANMVVEKKMSVRSLEEFIKSKKREMPKVADDGTQMEKNVNYDALEISERISNALSMRAKLKITNSGGVLTVYCDTCEKLERLTDVLLSVG